MRCIRICLSTCLVLALLPAADGQTAPASQPSSAQLKDLAEQQRRSPNKVLPVCRQAFEAWLRDDPANKSLQAFWQRLQALRALTDRIRDNLEGVGVVATNRLLDELLVESEAVTPARTQLPADVVPAERVYAEFLPHFVQGIDVTDLDAAAQDFLKTLYNAEVQEMIDDLARLGLALACLDRMSYELDYYLLLLPLLHSPGGFDARLLDILPERARTPDRLSHMADFCLLRLGRPDAAATISSRLAGQKPSEATLYQYYLNAASRCVADMRPARAVECLQLAVKLFPPADPKAVDLRFRICETWAAARNYTLAAGEAGQIARDMVGTEAEGKAVYLRIKYLSQQSNDRSVLLEVDRALANERCQPYAEELTFLKWKSLRKEGKGEQASHVLKRFLEAYPESAYAAEMYYAVAVDCLAAQRHDDSLRILRSLVQKYPTSPIVREAQPLMDRIVSFTRERAAASQP